MQFYNRTTLKMTRIVTTFIFSLGFIIVITPLSFFNIYVLEMYTYGVSKEITSVLFLLIILIGAIISSSGYGIGTVIFKVPIRHLYSFIFGFVFAVITIGVVWTTRRFISPIVSDDFIIVVFLFIGGLYSASIIKRIIKVGGNNKAMS